MSRGFLGSLIVLALMSATPLSAAPPDAVDRYGDPLPAGAVERLGTVRLRSFGAAEVVAYSPDGRVLAAGTDSGDVYLWEAGSGRPTPSIVCLRG